MQKAMTTITATIKRETDAAILVECDGNEVWLPKSQIDYDEDCTEGDEIEIEVPQWLADSKGLS